MASDPRFVEFVADQFDDAYKVTSRKMFGDYGLWSDGLFFALVCDNHLFVKPTEAGRKFIGDVVEAPAYPGAKLSFLIEDRIEDGQWLSELLRVTLQELPPPKPRRKRKKKNKS
jgi:TfoX/Sxy family transcriptional regulator of competence genes